MKINCAVGDTIHVGELFANQKYDRPENYYIATITEVTDDAYKYQIHQWVYDGTTTPKFGHRRDHRTWTKSHIAALGHPDNYIRIIKQ